MNLQAAKTLCTTLVRQTRTRRLTLTAKVELGAPERFACLDQMGKATRGYRSSARIVFSGAATGSHSVDVYASDPERVLAHWSGYIEASRMAAPAVGQLVEFPSASAWRAGGFRYGRVVKVGTKRAIVSYKFKHGGEATASVPFSALRFDPRPVNPPIRFESV